MAAKRPADRPLSADHVAGLCRSRHDRYSRLRIFRSPTAAAEAAARRVVELARRLDKERLRINAVRLDSGDLAELSRRVRRILDEGGYPDIGIFASGNVDEYTLEVLVAAGAPIEGYGIGTSLDVSADAPALDCVYKIQEYAGQARRKRSTGKATLPGRKQVFRQCDDNGRLREDILTVIEDEHPGQPLLQPVMRNGQRTQETPSLASLRQRTRSQLDCLPPGLCSLSQHADYPVQVAPALEALARRVNSHFR